ncbi:hypothetical protein BsWGS_24769 [Bradybaena similaris]
MKHRSTNSKRTVSSKLSGETISTRTLRSGSEKSEKKAKVNTCYEYFKVKKSPSSPEDSKPRTADAAKETCSGSLTPNQTQSKDGYLTPTRPRRLRYDSLKLSDVKHQGSPGLCIEDVRMLVEAQDSYGGGVNCYVCGKLYKSKVCFIKHIWEHTVYWNIFEGAKNHERVLSIQAAIIMYCGMTSHANGASISDLCNLLVTSPHSSEMKQEKDSGSTPNSDELNSSFLAMLSEVCAEQSPLVVENGEEKSDENAVRNSLHNGAPKCPEGVTLTNQNASFDSCNQMPSTRTGECWGQPCSHIAYLLSEISLLSPPRAHSTLLFTPPKLQTSPTVFPPPRPPSYPAGMSTAKPHSYSAEISTAKPHSYSAEISTAKPHSYSAEIFTAKPHSYSAEISTTKPHSHFAEIFPPAKPHSYSLDNIPLAKPHSYSAEISTTKPHLYSAEIFPLTKPHSYSAEIFPPAKLHSYSLENVPSVKPHSHSAEIFPPTKPHSYATVCSAPSNAQTYPTIFPTPAKPQCYLTKGFPPPQPHMFPIFSTPLPKPQTNPNLASSLPVLMLTSLPASQLSSDACRGYTNSRYTSTDTYGTLENNDASFVSPLKRKRED